jgi:hypothetical protein
MSRIALRSLSALALLTATTGLILAQGAAVQPATGTLGTTVRAKSILGASVTLKGGTTAGTVEDIVLSNEGVVDYLVVSKGGKLVTVPWDAVRFDYAKRMATVNITPERYQQIPTYTTTTYPNFYAPTYRTEVYKAYGLTPGQQRRLERRLGR